MALVHRCVTGTAWQQERTGLYGGAAAKVSDPEVTILEDIRNMAFAIKKAVGTVRENKIECRRIEQRVHRVSNMLLLLKRPEIMECWTVSALENLMDAVCLAHEVVMACQGRNILCLFCAARNVARKLHFVLDDISEGMMRAIFASPVVVFVAPESKHGYDNRPFFTRRYQKLPVSESLPSPRPLVEDLHPILPTHEAPAPIVVGDDLVPHRPPHVPPCYAPDNDVSNLQPCAHAQIVPPPPSRPPRTNVAPPVPKHLSCSPPKQPTRPQPPSPPPPPSNHITNIVPPKPAGLPRHSSSQSTLDVTVPVSGSFSSSPTTEDFRKCDETENNEPAKSEAPSPHIPGLTKFSLSEFRDATYTFSEKNKIGSTDFANVYKGVLRNGLMVSIKEFRDPRPFHAELHLASKLHSKGVEATGTNKNIIRFIGSSEPDIFIVEEYLPHRDMSKIIYGSQHDWSSRFQIIQGIAQGLCYLHEHKIVHMNMKPANILLDSDMNPKIADFGIARMFEQKEEMIQYDSTIAGTVGYMPPEYILEGLLSTKHDVYSFGIIVLETISGMSRADKPARHHASVPWAWSVRNCQPMRELFDPLLLPEESQVTEVKRCLEIGLLCTQSEWSARPAMKDVIAMLNGEKELANPEQPEYTKERGTTAKGASRKARIRRR